MLSRLRRLILLFGLGAVVAAIAAGTAGGGSYTPVGGGCVQSNQAYVSGYNSWTVNVVRVPYFCSGGSGSVSWACLYYIRPNGDQYVHSCFLFEGAPYPPGYIDYVDPRDISYGRAVCKNEGTKAMWFQFCWAGT